MLLKLYYIYIHYTDIGCKQGKGIFMIKRCFWVNEDPLYINYHDREWGVPVYDDKTLFEFLILEGMQAGLSWYTILRKRTAFRASFDKFNAKKIAQYKQGKIKQLMSNPAIIRNNLKIQSAVINAQAYLETKEEFGTFSKYLWSFVGSKPIQNHLKQGQVIITSPISDAMSKDLKKRGFKFVGSTICYAFMQAVGMVNDHTEDCFRYKELKKLNRSAQ